MLRKLSISCQYSAHSLIVIGWEGRIHIDVQGDELAISGALPRIESVAEADGQARRAGHHGLSVSRVSIKRTPKT